MVYSLGSRGVALMRREHDIPFSRMTWGKGGQDVGRVFLDHTLMVAEIVLRIEAACRESGGRVRFVSADELEAASERKVKGEPFAWRATIEGKRIGLVPDAVIALEFAEAPEASRRIIVCLEADRGTMPVVRWSLHLSSLHRKLVSYAHLWKAGIFAKRFGTKRLAVLTVTTSEARVKTMEAAVGKLSHGRGLFTCCTEAAIASDAWQLIKRWQPSVGQAGDSRADF
jgi:hypothetical protein